MRQIGKIFLQGLAAILPLGLTLYVLWWLGSSAERLLGPWIRRLLPEGAYLPGLGVAVGLAIVFGIGMLLRAWWIRSLWSTAERLLEHVPLVKTIYGSVKDMMTFFAEGERKKELDQVVLIRLGAPPLQLMGLVTSRDVHGMTGRDEDEDQVAVYLPMSYQIGGFMVFVPRSAVEPVDLGVEDAFRMIVTAGLSRHGPGSGAGARVGRS